MEAGGPGGGGGSRSDGHSPEALGCADPTRLRAKHTPPLGSGRKLLTEAQFPFVSLQADLLGQRHS